MGWIRRLKTACAVLLGDKHLLSQLSTGDMVAINAVYHRACLTRLYRKVEKVRCDTKESYTTQLIQVQVVNELLDYIDNNRGSGTPMEMADLTMLTALYDKRLVALGFPDIKCNTTHLREDIEHMVPDIKSPLRMIRAGLLSLMITWTE